MCSTEVWVPPEPPAVPMEEDEPCVVELHDPEEAGMVRRVCIGEEGVWGTLEWEVNSPGGGGGGGREGAEIRWGGNQPQKEGERVLMGGQTAPGGGQGGDRRPRGGPSPLPSFSPSAPQWTTAL